MKLINLFKKFLPNLKEGDCIGSNTLDNFKEPCFIPKLLNERPEGLIVEQIYDIGITDTINAIVDISPITKLNENQEFLVNIISQELRFEKNINFYNPYEFKHTGKEKSKDGDDSYDDEPTSEVIPKDNEGSESASLALAIVVPILAVIIIILIVLLIFSRKINSSKRSKEEIEKLV